MLGDLTHFDADGNVHMVDVSQKPVSHREAVASGEIRMEPATLDAIVNRRLSKGDVLQVARLAGIMASKQTSQLIPLCHPLSLSRVEIALTPCPPQILRIEASVAVAAQTGAEMEALTAVSVAALTVYDMCKSIDRTMTIQMIQLESKTGGKSGNFRRMAAVRPTTKLAHPERRLARVSGGISRSKISTSSAASLAAPRLTGELD